MSSVGIYMPANNVEKYIMESIESILQQTHADWELIILDDCSTDKTFDVASSVKDDRIKIFKRDEKCGKIGKLKNEVISKFTKKHDFLCHVGSDDLIPKYSLKTFVNYLERHDEVGACCGNFLCFTDDGKKWELDHVKNTGKFDPETLLKYMCMFPLRFYRSEVIEAIGGYSNELSSAVDYDLALKISEKFIIHRIKDPITYFYRQHNNQVSTKARPEQNLNAKNALEDALKRRNINKKVLNGHPPFLIK